MSLVWVNAWRSSDGSHWGAPERQHSGRPKIASREVIRRFITEATTAVPGHKFSVAFLLAEWEELVDAWQLENWESYRDVKRLGRKTRLQEPQRATSWAILDAVRVRLRTAGLITRAAMFTA